MWQSFTVDALPIPTFSLLALHVEVHGESIVKPDMTGPGIKGDDDADGDIERHHACMLP